MHLMQAIDLRIANCLLAVRRETIPTQDESG